MKVIACANLLYCCLTACQAIACSPTAVQLSVVSRLLVVVFEIIHFICNLSVK
jgi:hypothetical protein